MNAEEIQDYIEGHYGHMQHCADSMELALDYTANEYDVDVEDLFHLIIENEPMSGTHSYGFHTAYGRGLINTFKNEYYNHAR